MRRRAANACVVSLGVALALALASCTRTPATQVLVVIDAERGVREAAPRLSLAVRGGDAEGSAITADRFSLDLRPGDTHPRYPFSIAIAPRGGDVERVYEITATAQAEDQTFVAQVRAISGFIAGRTIELRLILEDACRDRQCRDDETCRGGACVSALVDVATLGYDAGAPLDASDAGAPLDAPDAGACGCTFDDLCFAGTDPAACGVGGSPCAVCRSPTAACVEGACVAATPVAAVSTGDLHTCALDAAGAAWCWGTGPLGELGIGSGAGYWEEPVRVITDATAPTYSTISAAGDASAHTCALDREGAAWCWGGNEAGQLGQGISGFEDQWTARRTDLGPFAAIATGDRFTCATRREDRRIVCWGSSADGRTGGGVDAVTATVPGDSPATTDTIALDLGDAHGCAISGTSALRCWGGNDMGQLGIDRISFTELPTAVSSGWRSVSCGWAHTCAIAGTGELRCWGGAGPWLGLGARTEPVTRPTTVGAATDWTRIACGTTHSCGIRGGALYCWGENEYGQLGIGTVEPQPEPARVGDRSDWRDVATGLQHTCAIHTDGLLECWGSDGHGQLGSPGVPMSVALPVPVILE
jgi:alpha-tubulin suppressor-like RCC1 family protein